MNNNLTYNGLVRFKLKYKDGKEVSISKHNLGTDSLFNLFAQALYGLNISNRVPQAIIIKKNLDITDPLNPSGGEAISTIIPILNENKSYGKLDITNDGTPDSYGAVFRIFILKSNMISIANDTNYICLLDSNSNAANILAYVSIPKTDLDKITDTVQGLVEWNMYVSNSSN